MQVIYIYIPETKHDPTAYSVAAVLYLQFVQREMLFRSCNTFCAFTLAFSKVCVQWPMWLLFCIYFIIYIIIIIIIIITIM